MIDYELINTVTNVVNTSKGIIFYYQRYNVVRTYDLNMLKDHLEARNRERRAENYKNLFMKNMDIMEDCVRRIEQYPDGSYLQKNAMEHFEIINNKLVRLLESY